MYTHPQSYHFSRNLMYSFSTCNCFHLGGHLKSSHIADKQKNVSYGTLPLPPSSNESVIDNASNVRQTAMHIIFVLPHNLPKQCRLSHPGTLPLRSQVQRQLRNAQRDNLEKNMISTLVFFLFLHARKRAVGVDIQCPTGASACHCLSTAFKFNLAFKSQSISAMDRLQPHGYACTSRLFCLDLFEIAQWLATLIGDPVSVMVLAGKS